MLNYFNYFTEIEERFQQRRGSILLLSTLDWALIETWREAGIPLAAALRGIDAAFDKYEARQKKARMRRVNGLAWCAQAVMEAAEELREAAAGTAPATSAARDSGFEHERVAAHLEAAAIALDAAQVAHDAGQRGADDELVKHGQHHGQQQARQDDHDLPVAQVGRTASVASPGRGRRGRACLTHSWSPS